jgi:hypothetical protein
MHPRTFPAPFAEYLRTEISPMDLTELLDEHLAEFVRLAAASEDVWGNEQWSTYHHLRRLRDLFRGVAEAAMKVEQLEAIAS